MFDCIDYEIRLSVKDLDDSVAFYKDIGFELILRAKDSSEFAVFTDGHRRFVLLEDDFSSPVISFFSNNLGEVRHYLEENEVAFTGSDYLCFSSPSGVPITVSGSSFWGKLTLPSFEFPLGSFGELTIPVDSLADSSDFWQMLGFTVKASEDRPYSWQILNDGLLNIGLHDSSNHFGITLTFFSEHTSALIESFREKEFNFIFEQSDQTGEIRHVAVASPDNQPIYLFEWKKENS